MGTFKKQEDIAKTNVNLLVFVTATGVIQKIMKLLSFYRDHHSREMIETMKHYILSLGYLVWLIIELHKSIRIYRSSREVRIRERSENLPDIPPEPMFSFLLLIAAPNPGYADPAKKRSISKK